MRYDPMGFLYYMANKDGIPEEMQLTAKISIQFSDFVNTLSDYIQHVLNYEPIEEQKIALNYLEELNDNLCSFFPDTEKSE